MRSRTIEYKIDERFFKRFVGSISKWQVVDDIELMISVRLEMLKQEKEDRDKLDNEGSKEGFFKWGIIIDDFKILGNLEVDISFMKVGRL